MTISNNATMTNKATLQPYLDRYGESENQALSEFPVDHQFEHVLVIPAFNESPAFLHRLHEGLAQRHALLCILVINQPENFSDELVNQSLWQSAYTSGAMVWQRENLSLIDWPETLSQLLIVNRFTEKHRIAKSQGVGLARKIGCDLAAALKNNRVINSDWIHTTDADAILPADYFDQVQTTARSNPNISAALYRFSHQCASDSIGRAHKLYEQSLHYYVEALRWTESPYAFHTIGSCIAVNIEHYSQARGFPKRAGGEDFYLLNKLAKLAPIVSLDGDPIHLQARESTRAPFGTGPAVNKIAAMEDPTLDFQSYDPRIFVQLKDCLQQLSQLWRYRENLGAWRAQLPPTLESALNHLGLEELLSHLTKQAKTERQFVKQTTFWFDGFRTLKFIHFLQQNYFPAVPLHKAVAQFEQISGIDLHHHTQRDKSGHDREANAI